MINIFETQKGTAGRDFLYNFSGHDTFVFAGGGADIILTSVGNDTIILGESTALADRYVVSGRTLVYAGAGDDEIHFLTGGAQAALGTFIEGDIGNDTVVLEGSSDRWWDLGTVTYDFGIYTGDYELWYDLDTRSTVFMRGIENVTFDTAGVGGLMDLNDDGRELAIFGWNTGPSQSFTVTGIAAPIANLGEALVMNFMFEFMGLSAHLNSEGAIWFMNDDEFEDYIVSQDTPENNLFDIYEYAFHTADNYDSGGWYGQAAVDNLRNQFWLEMANDPEIAQLAPENYDWDYFG